VLVVLAVLTAAEYGIAVTVPALSIALIAIALVKAGLVLYFFMHIMRVFREEGDH
jgi:heme/copper-type cytochrome/quinol oxidase subunit 4